MTCLRVGDAIVCGSFGAPVRRKILTCPRCKQDRRMTVRWDGPYYGSTVTCTACGDRWMDGEPAPRGQFGVYAKSAKQQAVKDWFDPLTCSPREFDREVRESIRRSLGDER